MSSLPSATFDQVCAPLRCPWCSREMVDPCEIGMQTRLARNPSMARLHVGSALRPKEDPEEAGYYRVSERPDPSRLRVIETWSCPFCGGSFLWAVLVVEEHVLVSVETVKLDAETLGRVDYITGQVAYLTPIGEDVKLNDVGLEELRAEIVRLERSRTEL